MELTRDPRKDPRPGDVLEYNGVRTAVKAINGDIILAESAYTGGGVMSMTYSIILTREVWEYRFAWAMVKSIGEETTNENPDNHSSTDAGQ